MYQHNPLWTVNNKLRLIKLLKVTLNMVKSEDKVNLVTLHRIPQLCIDSTTTSNYLIASKILVVCETI